MANVAQRKGRRRDPESRSRPPQASSGDDWIDDEDLEAIARLVGVDTTGTPGSEDIQWKTRRELRRAKIPLVKRLHSVIARAVELARRIDDAKVAEGVEWGSLVKDAEQMHAAAFGAQDEDVVLRVRVMDIVEWAANELRWDNLRRLQARRCLGDKLNREERKLAAALSEEDARRLNDEISSMGGAGRVHSDEHDRSRLKIATKAAARRIAELRPNLTNKIKTTLVTNLADLIKTYSEARSEKPKEGYAVAYLALLGLGCDERSLKTAMARHRDLGRSLS